MRITYMLMNAYATGGTVRTVFNQVNALARRGHRVEIISAVAHRRRLRFTLDPRVRLRVLVDNAPRRGPAAALTRWRRRIRPSRPGIHVPYNETRKYVFTREVENAVINALRGMDSDVDVLVTTRPALNLLAARYAPATVPTVAQEHQCPLKHKGALREAIIADYPELDALVTLTDGDRRHYREILGDRLRVTSVPNAVHSLDVTRADPRAKVIVAAGRLTGAKGFDLLIPAFAQLADRAPDWRLRIFGSGPEEPALRALVARHGLESRVSLPGNSRRLGFELARASVYAMSSRVEGFPMVLLEALSHGLPVVSFDCDGVDDIITDGREGLIVPGGDVDSFAKGLLRLVDDVDARNQMGAAARDTALRYGPESVATRWERLFASLRGGDGGG